MTVDMERWLGITDAERRLLAQGLLASLPLGASLGGIETHKAGERSYPVARFQLDGSAFVLVPGGEHSVGYDASRRWSPREHEAASWAMTAAEYDLEDDLAGYIAKSTTRPRQVSAPPLLVAVEAVEYGFERLCGEAAEAFIAQHGRGPVEVRSSAGHLRIRPEAGGVRVERAVSHTHASLLAALAAEGMRLPTSDEWEFLCGAGAQTLFRWGDHTPGHCYPTDRGDWTRHREPNALGLHIAEDPYRYEVVMEPTHRRGGDGGSSICGGAGFFMGWLPLASAFFDQYGSTAPGDGVLQSGFSFARRVLPLG